jgi:hypothetical protein
MHKYACIAVLFISALCTAQSAQIVAKGKRVNQTAAIPSSTIYSPTQDGLYRLSIYATVNKADPNSQSDWNLYVFWNDGTGLQQITPLIGDGNMLGQFAQMFFVVPPIAGPVIVMEAKAGSRIGFQVVQGGPADNSTYSLYYTLEQLE